MEDQSGGKKVKPKKRDLNNVYRRGMLRKQLNITETHQCREPKRSEGPNHRRGGRVIPPQRDHRGPRGRG